ncbi:putative molecular chaperone regulator BAG-1, Ubiquitin-like domain superfamily [Helianthus annuus]|uniref:Molecular chaperone regulator BAG-1, Ubiquitin-like domain superfamily n=1 Tax=Helianthus annuus TaxID=4232 RepID=A0A251UEA6_HELAN|nr:BAG family molecular chaperone regulator 2 [Helianthus annuus]KAF5800481.1 putative molecular chaperone regulator BAG-1, Ubiquitin-like domain superfamily [Helianthus annuus]KAJ0551788.1 putative Ubiquitin-like domain, BAG domain, Ubiquitin-like domain superfamily [Helianthus annuus]
MMPMRTTATDPDLSSRATGEWEVRPGGMLVQKRDPNDEHNPLTIRVRVKYGSIYHEINISSQATFGELKKMLSGPTGLHHEDQKLMYKNKERSSKTFLDVVGVKDRSKMVLVEDPISQERRYVEMRKNAMMEKAAKAISEISLEVDRLAGQVSAHESVISKGGKVAEKTLLVLIELLMNQLLKLDEIIAEGDVKLQRKMQVKRVQKYVETLDVLKIKNSSQVQEQPASRNQEHGSSNTDWPRSFPNSRRSVGNFSSIPAVPKPRQPSTSGEVVVTTKWETFDSMPTPLPAPPSNTIHPKFSWDLL